MKLRRKVTLSIVGTLVLFLLFLMYAPFSFAVRSNKSDFNEVLKAAELGDDVLVTEVKMLGAHDAFSHKINLLSKVDPAETGIASNKIAKAVFKGGIVRAARAQKHGAKELLQSGVRYFDVRISYALDTWYTKHAYLSAPLVEYLSEIYTFLNTYKTEFIIFDVQHIYTGEKSVNDFINYLNSHALNGNVFSDYMHFDAETVALSSLRYKDTLSATKGGIIFLINSDESITNVNKQYFYERGDGESATSNIRSFWHNENETKNIIPQINAEKDYLKANTFTGLRVNQAQLTPDYLKAPIRTLWQWTLLDLANHSNNLLLSHDNFLEWLSVMPIFMVDHASSGYKNFAQTINQAMITANKQLSV